MNNLIPNESVITKNGVINPTMYDLKKPSDFFNERQLLVLVTLIDEISKNYVENCKKYGLDYSNQIVLGLTSLAPDLIPSSTAIIKSELLTLNLLNSNLFALAASL